MKRIKVTEETPIGKKIIELHNNKGMSAYEISRYKSDEVPLSEPTIDKYIEEFKGKGLIKSDKEIQEARKQRKLEMTLKVAKLYNDGITPSEMHEQKSLPLTIKEIYNEIQKARRHGLINSDEEIKKAKELKMLKDTPYEDEDEELRKLKANPEVQRIRDCINQKGMIDREIYEDKENGVNLTRDMIGKYRRKLKDYGLLNSDEEIEKARWFWELKENPLILKIIKYHNEKITPCQMYKQGLVQMSHQTISKYIEKYEKYGVINPDEEIEETTDFDENQIKNKKKIIKR